MRLNHDCVRDVLLFIEQEHRPGRFISLQQFLSADVLSDHYSADDIKYTLLQLLDAGFIQGTPTYTYNSLAMFSCGGLTWNGCQFIDTIRDNKVWHQTKIAASKLSSVSMTILSSIATKALSKILGL